MPRTLLRLLTNVRLQIEEGLAYFRKQAANGESKVEALHDALVAAAGDGSSGDAQLQRQASAPMAEVAAAYVASRPEYEQIEVLAPGFGDVDCWIDCRACAPF